MTMPTSTFTLKSPSAQEIQQPVAVIRAERFDQILGHHPHACIHQTDIAPGAAETDLGSLQHRDAQAPLGQMQRGGKPGIARANHRNIGHSLGLQRRGFRGGRRGHRP